MNNHLSITLAMALGVSAAWASVGNAAEEVTLFTEPPTAQELADIMFPNQPRSIVFDDGTKVEPEAEVAASAQAEPTEAAPAEGSGFGLLINFHFGEATVTEESLAYLDAVGQMLSLEQSGDQAILIEGHTDAVGSAQYNQGLSEQRALAVQEYLIRVHNIDQARLNPVGKGELHLYEPADPKAAVNRRVEFKLLDVADAS
ncbi:MAG: OmpA family protein [Gammaproteobacteria bacterium]|nr:OmpA family protein [Gammaproteobacteria bacterium]